MIDSLLNSVQISQIFGIFFQVVSTIVAIIILPISFFIHTYMPAVDGAFGFINTYLNLATSYSGWVIDALGVPHIVILIVVAYYVFTTTVSIAIIPIKRALIWYAVVKL